MELKEFIKETICQITDGLIEGNDYVIDNKLGTGVSKAYSKVVDFDIAITSSNEKENGKGAKLQVASFISAGLNSSNVTSIQNSNRIKFSIELDVFTKN